MKEQKNATVAKPTRKYTKSGKFSQSVTNRTKRAITKATPAGDAMEDVRQWSGIISKNITTMRPQVLAAAVSVFDKLTTK